MIKIKGGNYRGARIYRLIAALRASDMTDLEELDAFPKLQKELQKSAPDEHRVYGLMLSLGRGGSKWALRQLEITGNRNEWLIEEGKKLGL